MNGRRAPDVGRYSTLMRSPAFPRLLAPRFIPRSRYQLNWTRFTLNADLLNRPHYFKMAQFNAAVTYDWRLRRHVQNSFTPFKLTYTNLMNTTADFDSIMAANPAVAQSFKSQFIPQMQYSYTYDRQINPDNTINVQFSVQEAGNIFRSLDQAAGKKGEKKLFGTPFSQFVKGQIQLVYGRRIFYGDNWLVTRVACGAAHAYGNSSQVPYAEQFYVGGANSIRAFTVRSIGPGSYRAPEGQPEDYFDRTGTFKFEANVEYRFPISGILHGALFLDAGNVWLLKKDAMRPGGTLRGKTFLRDLALGTGVGLRVDYPFSSFAATSESVSMRLILPVTEDITICRVSANRSRSISQSAIRSEHFRGLGVVLVYCQTRINPETMALIKNREEREFEELHKVEEQIRIGRRRERVQRLTIVALGLLVIASAASHFCCRHYGCRK